MQLSNLLQGLYSLDPALDRELKGLAQNSQQVEKGYVFVACRGRTFDGRQYIDEALRKGAVAVLVDAEMPGLSLHHQVPLIQIPGLQQKLYPLAAKFFNYPCQALHLLGVTGTNGKTSCTHFMAQLLQKLQAPCAVIGTLGSGFLEALKETGMTTPDAIQLQKIFSELRALQAQYVAMEVSSHSLDQGRVQGLAFEVGVFTNLTQDHLDYHGDMATYGRVKQSFFSAYPMRRAVINADDVFGQVIAASLASEKVLTYSVQGKASVYVERPRFELSGIQAELFTPWGEAALSLPLIGAFNLSNALAVVTALGSLGFPLASIVSGLAALKAVPGRMQLLGREAGPRFIIDYAHTPDALEKTLLALRQHCQGQLYCVFGCGGDRDRGKRPLMGAIAEQYADQVCLTSDNPRHEKPEAILAEILQGMKNPKRVRVEANRSKAIQDIIQCAGAGDYVLVAGKGAETYQQIGDQRLPFSDEAEILAFLGK